LLLLLVIFLFFYFFILFLFFNACKVRHYLFLAAEFELRIDCQCRRAV